MFLSGFLLRKVMETNGQLTKGTEDINRKTVGIQDANSAICTVSNTSLLEDQLLTCQEIVEEVSQLDFTDSLASQKIGLSEIEPLPEACNNVTHNNQNIQLTEIYSTEQIIEASPDFGIIPQVIVTGENENQRFVTETANTKRNTTEHRKVLKYSPSSDGESISNSSTAEMGRSPGKSSSRVGKRTKLSTSYENPNFSDFKKTTQEYYKFLNRYHVADTLPVFSRTKLQIELRKLGVDSINIGLFGQPGSGKSALLNTMYSAITGTYLEYAAERKTFRKYDNESVTNHRLELRLTENIRIWDNRGIDFSKQSLNEAAKQCEGFREAGEFIPANWNGGIKQKLKDMFARCNRKLLYRNRIQCPIIVSSLIQDFDATAMKDLIDVLKYSCYCNPVVMVTHINEVQNYGKEILTARIQNFEDLNCARIFAIENYTYSQHQQNSVTDEKMIEALFNCCLVADQAAAATIATVENGVCF